jgi:transposase
LALAKPACHVGPRLEPKTTRHKPTSKIDMQALKEDINRYPDACHDERAKRFNVSKQGIGKALKRLGISYKKNANASEEPSRRTACLPKEG